MVSFAEFLKENSVKAEECNPTNTGEYIDFFYDENGVAILKKDLRVWVEKQIQEMEQEKRKYFIDTGNNQIIFRLNKRIEFCEEMLAGLKPCESLTKPRISCEKHSEGLK